MVTYNTIMARKSQKIDWPKKLRALRERLGLSQAAAAKLIGVTRDAWAAWETRGIEPTESHQLLIAFLEDGTIRP